MFTHLQDISDDLLTCVQPVTPRSETLRMQISNLAWEKGLGYYFSQGVPFSLFNGRYFAEKLAFVFSEWAKQNELSRIQVAEMGAGMGLLSVFFLNVLEEKYPDLYAKTHVWVTDSRYEDRKDIPLFKPHVSHISFAACDAVSPSFPKTPDFVFSINLLDSLHSTPLQWENGILQEIQFETYLPKNAVILDKTDGLPRPIGEPEIVAELKQNSDAFLRQNTEQLLMQLVEKPVLKPLPELPAHLNSNELSFILGDAQRGAFNYSGDSFTHIKKVLDLLPEHGCYMVCDFGFSDDIPDAEPYQLMVPYGAFAFHSVCFKLLRDFIMKQGASTWISQQELDSPKVMMVAKNAFSDSIQNVFESQFSSLFSENYNEVIERVLYQNVPLRDAYNQMPDVFRSDYYFLKTLGTRAIENHQFEDALFFASNLIDTYRSFARDGLIIKAWVYQAAVEHQMAADLLENALEFNQKDPAFLAALGISYCHLGRLDESVDCLKKAINLSPIEEMWSYVFYLGKCWQLQGKSDKKEAIVRYLEHIAKRIPSQMTPQTLELITILKSS